jgi:hypothetical protein
MAAVAGISEASVRRIWHPAATASHLQTTTAATEDAFTREDGSRVVAPRKEWYSLCVSSGLGKYEPVARKNGESYKKHVGLNPHDFRRSVRRYMTRRGVTEKGHSTRSVFDRYNIVDETDLAEATKKIEAFSPRPSSSTRLTHANVGVS